MTAVHTLPAPAPTEFRSEILDITPEMAERCLGRNEHNRHVKPRVVAAYAGQMTRGEWLLTGEAIKFAVDGNLIDGQHRLHAIVQSGKTIRMLVLYGLSPDVQDVLDTGSQRGAQDQLQIHGYENASILASSAKIAILYETSRFYVDSHKKQVSHREVLDFVAGNTLLGFACSRANTISRGCDLRPAVVAMCFYELLKIDDADAIEFFDRLTDGVNLPPRHPLLALRSRLSALRRDRTTLPSEVLVALVFRTWNACRSRRALTSLPIYANGEYVQCPVLN
jgi:hypothetical protein